MARNITEKQKANLVKFTSETSRAAQKKSVEARHSNSELIKLIDENYDYILSVLAKCKTDKDFEKALEKCPNYFVRIYLRDISKEQLSRLVVEQIIDRVKGKPKQQIEAQVEGTGDFVINVSSKKQGDDVVKAMED